MRNTKQRNIIFDIVDNSYDHLNAYQIYDIAKVKIPNISLGTVYRNLSNLVEDDKIKKFEVSNTFRFDRKQRHVHFICNKCNSISDIFYNFFNDDMYIDGNLVNDYDVKFTGICKKCMERNDN